MLEEESKIQWRLFLLGDDNAYNWIYKEYVQSLYRYGLKFSTDREIIKDCIQEVFAKLYKERKQLVIPNNVKVYLFVSLKNSLLRRIYRESIYEHNPEETVPFQLEAGVEEEFIGKEAYQNLQGQVEKILSILSPRQREIIYYRFIQELGFDEICQLMDLNYQSAPNLSQRSLKKIRENFNKPSFE